MIGKRLDGTSPLRLVMKHAIIGWFIGLSFVALMLAFDVAKIWTLASSNSAGVLAIGVMSVFFAITFGSVQVGIALTLEAERTDPPNSKKRKMPQLAFARAVFGPARRPAPVPVPVRAAPQR